MTLNVVYPAREHSAYKIAAETFCTLAEQVSGAVTCLSLIGAPSIIFDRIFARDLPPFNY